MTASKLAEIGAGHALGLAIDTAALWRTGNKRLGVAVKALLKIRRQLERMARIWESEKQDEE